jgi:hypothetical protein
MKWKRFSRKKFWPNQGNSLKAGTEYDSIKTLRGEELEKLFG